MAENNTINTTLDDVFKNTPAGSIDRAIGNAVYGINHRQQPSAVPINKDLHGLTFFTRPQLNLSKQNIRADRQFVPLMSEEPASIQRIIRNTLDPRLNVRNNINPCPFVDNENVFIPLLTNHLLTCTGWPDPITETYSSKSGAYKEVFGYTDGIIDKYSAFDITANFRNMVGDPLTLMFHTWLVYQTNVFQGIMSPYPDFIVNNEIDYNTRIYRLILDKNKRFVQKIGCTGASYPVSVPLGSAFNYDHDKVLNQSNDQISINFRSFGFCYNDDIIVHEFNKAVSIFNRNMRPEYINSNMRKIPAEGLRIFNNKGYPRIDPSSYELTWYVAQDEYARVVTSFERHQDALNL